MPCKESYIVLKKGLRNNKEELIVKLMPFKMLRPLLLYINKEAFFFYSCGEFSTKTRASNRENYID